MLSISDVRQAAFARFNKNGGGLIKAYYVDHDILTQIQNLFSPLIPKALGTPIELDGNQDVLAIVGDAVLRAARESSKTPALAVALGLVGVGIKGYAGYRCHLANALLYGFLVK